MEKVVVSWSGGKDSALALQAILLDDHYEVISLLTTVNDVFCRISMHGVRQELLHEQAASIGIPVHEISLPGTVSNETYDTIMEREMLRLKKMGIRTSEISSWKTCGRIGKRTYRRLAWRQCFPSGAVQQET